MGVEKTIRIKVEEAIWRKLRMLCFEADETLTQFVSEAIRQAATCASPNLAKPIQSPTLSNPLSEESLSPKRQNQADSAAPRELTDPGPDAKRRALERKRIWVREGECLECQVVKGEQHKAWCGTGDRLSRE